MKPVFFQIFLGIVTLFTILSIVGGVVISQTFSFAFIFWGLFVVVLLATRQVRKFFLLPDNYFADALIHAVLVFIVLWLCNSFLGGVTIHSLLFPSFTVSGVKVIGTTLGTFGTIGVVSVLFGLLYQGLIWLNDGK